jgi:hypothetical protein
MSRSYPARDVWNAARRVAALPQSLDDVYYLDFVLPGIFIVMAGFAAQAALFRRRTAR